MTREQLRFPPGLDGQAALVQPLRALPHAHRHDELELNLLTAGRAEYLDADDRLLVLGPGAVCWWFPSEDHLLIRAAPDSAMWVVKWRPSLVRAVVVAGADSRLAGQRHPLRRDAVIPRSAMQRLHGLFLALVADEGAPGPCNQGLAFALHHAWSTTVAAAVAAARPKPDHDLHPAVARALRLLRDDPACSLAVLAEEAGLSPDRLGRLVRTQLGTGLVTLRTQRRLEVAFARADAGGNLLTGAQEAGFASYAAFTRACRRIHGVAPQQVRRAESGT